MVDFGQWVSYVEYGHNASGTHFGRSKFGRIDPNFLGIFHFFPSQLLMRLLEFKTKH